MQSVLGKTILKLSVFYRITVNFRLLNVHRYDIIASQVNLTLNYC